MIPAGIIDFFLVIGVISVITVLWTLFSAWGRRTRYVWATQTPAVTSNDFLRAIAGALNVPIQTGGQVQLLNNGAEFYPKMLADLAAAQSTINFMFYIWEPGETADKFLNVLIERAKAGVEVRLLLDGLGAIRIPREPLQKLSDAGGKVEWFRQARLGKLTRFHKRNHRRALVIDGLVGYTGGAAIAEKWTGSAHNKDEWRDVMVRVEGPMARTLQTAFAQIWGDTVGEILVGEKFYPTFTSQDFADEAVPRHIGVVSSPTEESYPLRKFYWLSFSAASQKLYITNPYFVPDKNVRQSLKTAARKGVDVRLLLSGEHTDAKPIRYAAFAFYGDLLKAGVRIYEYLPTMLHTKLVVVDGVWSIVGSANMDIRSKEINKENVIGILDKKFGLAVEQTFLKDLKLAREIKYKEWLDRSFWHRLLETLWSLFSEQY